MARFIGESNIVTGLMKNETRVRFDDRDFDCRDYRFKPDELDVFLKAYREAGIPPVWLKATVTPHNMTWSAAQLYRELAEEHRQLHG